MSAAIIRVYAPTLRPRRKPLINRIAPYDCPANVVAIYQKEGVEEMNSDTVFLIDREDFEKVNQFRWRRGSSGYMMTDMWLSITYLGGSWIERRPVYLHHFLLDLHLQRLWSYCVDHIDACKTHNCKYNLRVVKSRENKKHASEMKKLQGKPDERKEFIAAIRQAPHQLTVPSWEQQSLATLAK